MRDRRPCASIQGQFASRARFSIDRSCTCPLIFKSNVLTLGTVSDDADSLTIARSVKVFAMREANEALEHLRKNHARYRAVLVNES